MASYRQNERDRARQGSYANALGFGYKDYNKGSDSRISRHANPNYPSDQPARQNMRPRSTRW